MGESGVDNIRYSYWIGLLGFFNETEAVQMAMNFDPDRKFEKTGFKKDLQEARTFVSKLTGRQTNMPEIREIGQSNTYKERIEKLESEPTFKEHLIGMKSYKFAMIELSNLHVFQPLLNEEYIEKLELEAPAVGDENGLLQFCLPLKEERPKSLVYTNFNPSTNTISLVTENLDLRILGNVQGQDPNSDRPFGGFMYGLGLPQMSVVKYGNIYMIKNGYHRAFALLKKGHKFAPFILVETESFNFTGANVPGFFNIDSIKSDRAPLLQDFDSPAAVKLYRRRIRAVLSIHAELQFLTV